MTLQKQLECARIAWEDALDAAHAADATAAELHRITEVLHDELLAAEQALTQSIFS